MMYENCIGTEKNPEKAFEYYEKAANQGCAISQNALGCMYENGIGTEKNLEKAFEYCQKAADQGHVIAQNSLGCMYREGTGPAKNPEKAFEYYEKAANQGYAGAQNDLGCMYRDGNGIEKNPEKSLEYFQKSADQRHAEAQYALGLMYRDGNGTEKNPEKALDYFQKAADQGNGCATIKELAKTEIEKYSVSKSAIPSVIQISEKSLAEGGTPSWTGSAVQTSVRDCNKLYAEDSVFPTAFQLDGRIDSMSSQVTNWTYDFVDIFPGIHPGISKLFALLQFNSRTPTTSRRTPRWYLRGNQWLVGFNKQDFELAENQQMFGKTIDTLYQMLTGRSKKGEEDKQPFLVNLRNYFSHSPHPEVQQMQATTMAFFWRQDFFPNCSLVHLKNVSIPIHHEEFCKVSMAPNMLALDIPDWCSSVNSVNPAPLVTQSVAVQIIQPIQPIDKNNQKQPQLKKKKQQQQQSQQPIQPIAVKRPFILNVSESSAFSSAKKQTIQID
jgi:hypothetical protein